MARLLLLVSTLFFLSGCNCGDPGGSDAGSGGGAAGGSGGGVAGGSGGGAAGGSGGGVAGGSGGGVAGGSGGGAAGGSGGGAAGGSAGGVGGGAGETPLYATASSFHLLALRGDGTVWARGRSDFGQLGDGRPPAAGANPSLVRYDAGAAVGLSNVALVEQLSVASFAVGRDGGVWSWGAFGPSPGESWLGDGALTSRGAPAPANIADVVDLSAANAHVIAVKRDGTVWAWGVGLYGELGSPAVSSLLQPAQVMGPSNVVRVAAGQEHVLALTDGGQVWAWGRNRHGQLGNGMASFMSLPPAVVPGLSGVVAIGAGGSRSFAVTSDGVAWAWGQNFGGFLGVDAGVGADVPQPLPVLGASGVVTIDASWLHALALQADGGVLAWGSNNNDQLGVGADAPTPVHVPGLPPMVSVTVGEDNSFARSASGVLYGWGRASLLGRSPGAAPAPFDTLW